MPTGNDLEKRMGKSGYFMNGGTARRHGGLHGCRMGIGRRSGPMAIVFGCNNNFASSC